MKGFKQLRDRNDPWTETGAKVYLYSTKQNNKNSYDGKSTVAQIFILSTAALLQHWSFLHHVQSAEKKGNYTALVHRPPISLPLIQVVKNHEFVRFFFFLAALPTLTRGGNNIHKPRQRLHPQMSDQADCFCIISAYRNSSDLTSYLCVSPCNITGVLWITS